MAASSAAELLFNALDKNGDGVITRDEMRRSLGAPSATAEPSESSPQESVFTVAARTRALAQQAASTSPERTSPGRSLLRSPGGGSGGGGGSRSGTLSYEPAFVEALQAQQRARLEETLSAAERLLSAKEAELTELTATHKAAASAASAKERELQQQLDEATRKLAKMEAESESCRRKQEHSFASELAELKAIRAEELSHLRQQHETEMEELRTSCQEQIATIEANRRGVVDQCSRLQRDQSHMTEKARDLAAMYELQVQQLEQMLSDESQRLAEVRDELCNATMQSSNELLKERAEAAELRRKLVDAEEELVKRQGAHDEAVEMARQQHAQSVKQGELKAAIAIAEEEWRAEMVRKDKECNRLRRKVQELIEKGSSQQAQHDAELQEVRSDVLRMKDSHNTTVKFSRQQVEQNKDLMRLSRQLQKEVGISSNEVKLLENETRRLREDNVELRREVARLDNIIYGRKGNMAAGRRAAAASATTVGPASTPRRNTKPKAKGSGRVGSVSRSSRRPSSTARTARPSHSNLDQSHRDFEARFGLATPPPISAAAQRRRRREHSPGKSGLRQQAWDADATQYGGDADRSLYEDAQGQPRGYGTGEAGSL